MCDCTWEKLLGVLLLLLTILSLWFRLYYLHTVKFASSQVCPVISSLCIVGYIGNKKIYHWSSYSHHIGVIRTDWDAKRCHSPCTNLTVLSAVPALERHAPLFENLIWIQLLSLASEVERPTILMYFWHLNLTWSSNCNSAQFPNSHVPPELWHTVPWGAKTPELFLSQSVQCGDSVSAWLQHSALSQLSDSSLKLCHSSGIMALPSYSILYYQCYIQYIK